MSAVGDELKLLRLARGMTVREASAAANHKTSGWGSEAYVSRNTISRVERGESAPNRPTLEGLARAYDCSVQHLMRLLEQEPGKPRTHTPKFVRLVESRGWQYFYRR